MSAVILVPRLSEHVIPRALDQILIVKTEYPGTSVKFQEGTLLSSVRDRLVIDALTHPDKPEWALFLDSDMEFPPMLLARMIGRAERNDIKVLSGCYFSKDVDNPNPIVSSYLGILNDTPSFLPLSEEVSTFLEKHSMKAIGQNSAYIEAPDEEALIKVGGVGGGCLLVHREVLEKMEPPYFSFERGCSEDYYYCLKVAEMGYDVWCDLSVQCGHYTIAATSFRTFMSKYPKDQLQFRATVGNTHIHSMAEYMGESHLWVIDQIRNNKDNYGAFFRIGSDISPTFANTLNSISKVINNGEGRTALIYKGSAGTEAAILAQNKWDVVQYDTNEELLRYSEHYIKHMKLEDKATVTNELDGEYDFILVFDGFKHTVAFEEELTELVTRRLKKNGVIAMFCAPSVRKGEFNHSENWYRVINKLPLVQVAPILYQRT